MKSIRSVVLSVAVCLALFVLGSSQAQADTYDMIDPRLQKADKPMSLQLGVGPALGLMKLPTQVKVSEIFTWHFSGKHDGFFVGLQLDQSMSTGYFLLQARPVVGYAFRLIDKLALYFLPQIQAGIGLGINSIGLEYFFNLQAVLEVQLILDNRWLFSFKPLAVDVSLGAFNNVGLRMELMFGVGILL